MTFCQVCKDGFGKYEEHIKSVKHARAVKNKEWCAVYAEIDK
jgi:hypothetical protein